MTAFWIIAGLLVAGALLFVLPPLLSARPRPAAESATNIEVLRDQLRELEADRAAGSIDDTQYAHAREDLERRVLEEGAGAAPPAPAARPGRLAALAVGLALPLIAVSSYFALGSPGALDARQAGAGEGAAHALGPEQIQAMAERLAQRLRQQPDDVDGWRMLARSYSVLGRHAEAAQAYATLVNLVPGDAQLLADYADTLAMAQGRRLQGEPERIIARALQADGNNLKALALAGTVAFDKQDYKGAIAHWEKILALVPADSDAARSIAASIQEARTLGRIEPARATAAPAKAAVAGVVALDPKLRGKVRDSDTVFIYARAVDGPAMPLAVVRRQVKDLPAQFVLDDSNSMTAGSALSAHAKVVVGARISRSGSATPGAGDLEGLAGPIALGTKDVSILINSPRD